ncbi:MAG: VTT domain-containing protein [Acidobacteria bacterium]|jgi:membrane protein YqaA with SNARE-associated domain|nr:VTT domain-containing protein [Acidobacteriota bacterium]
MPPFAIFLAVSGIVRWLRNLGGPGLLLLGVADSSVVPLTGSMDALTIWLAASQRGWWFYYAVMATLGSVLGGYVTYMLARKGGKEMLERKLSHRNAERVYDTFHRWGFGAVAVPALLPPPFPIVPFLLAAGAMQYSRKRFLWALTLGRAVRFTVAAGLGAAYGRHVMHFFSQYYRPAVLVLVGLAVVGAVFSLAEYWRSRRRPAPEALQPKQRAA